MRRRIVATWLMILTLLLVIGCSSAAPATGQKAAPAKAATEAAKSPSPAPATTAPATPAAPKVDNPKYPVRPITLVVGWPPGGGTGLFVEALLDAAKKQFDQPLVAQYVPGASATVAATQVQRAPPDGYSVFLASNAAMVNEDLLRDLPYKPDDWIPIAEHREWTFALIVDGKSPINSLKDFVEAAKKRPGAISFGHAGTGTATELNVLMLEKVASIKLNSIPFDGNPPARAALQGGHVEAAAYPVSGLEEFTKAKQVKALAVFSEKRAPNLPDVPTAKELGYDVLLPAWDGIAVRKGTPDYIVQYLAEKHRKVAQDPAFKVVVENKLGQTVVYRDQKEFTQYLRDQQAMLKDLFASVGRLKKK